MLCDDAFYFIVDNLSRFDARWNGEHCKWRFSAREDDRVEGSLRLWVWRHFGRMLARAMSKEIGAKAGDHNGSSQRNQRRSDSGRVGDSIREHNFGGASVPRL